MCKTKENPETGKNCCHVCNMCVLALNVLLLIVNVCILCREAPRQDLSFDYMGVIVAIFGVLVTLLVAWNIFSVVDFKSQLEKAERHRKEMDEIKEALTWLNKYKQNRTQGVNENRETNPIEK